MLFCLLTPNLYPKLHKTAFIQFHFFFQDFTNLAPRKPDWDLKRDIAPKLEKLERRTQKAIAELIRERLKEEDLANAVTAGASAAQHLAEDED